MTRKILFSIALSILIFTLCLGAAAADTVYINDGGTGNGLSADSPVGTLDDAYDILGNGGTIVITDTYTLAEPFYAPLHTENITVTGGTFVTNHASYNRYYMAGPTVFENIKFIMGENNTSKTAMILAGYNPLVIGKGVTVESNLTVYIIGGYQHPVSDKEYNMVTDRDSSIVVESGSWHAVVGFSRGSGTTNYTGTSNITINGGTVNRVYGASIGGSYSGSTNITVNGGTVNTLYTAGDATRRINGDATVTVNGGTVKLLTVNNVMGRTTVNYLGGTIEAASRSVADKIKELVTDGKADLVVRKGVRAQSIMEFFDSALYEDGSEISGAVDADVASYTILDKKPEKSTAHPAKIYVANVGDGTGFSPDSPISDLKKAYEMLTGIDGTIVLVNTVEISGNFTEPEHDNHIVITSFDGERYFDGGLKFEKGKRFYYSGDTAFENTKIDFEGTLLFVGRFHNMTFGTGLVTPTTDVADIFVVGGYQLYESDNDVPHNVNQSITVESGNYYTVIGYTRGTEVSKYTHVFSGTQTLNLYGGSIDRVYGGPIQASVGDNVVINIDGVTVNTFIQAGGDQSNNSNTAVINMKSGYVKQLDMRNLLVSATVNWTGGDIESFACDNCVYNGVRDEEKYAAANEYKDTTYTLNYSGVTPTADALKFFTTVNSSVATVVKMTIGQNVGYINGEEKALDAAPVIRESRTMLPVRFVAEAFGAEIGWDGATSTATVKTVDTEIKITIGSKTAVVNGKEVTLDAPAFIENSRTYMPVRFVAENLGATVEWDGATSTATLTK